MLQNFNYDDIVRQVLAYMEKIGIQPVNLNSLSLDGNLHRFRTRDDDRNNKSGVYCIHADGWPAGFVQDWRKGIKENWKFDISGLDDKQRDYFSSEEFKKKCEERDRLAAEKRKQAKLKASRQAKLLWDALKPAQDTHPYLERKHVKAHGLRFHKDSNSLAVPLATIDGIVRSIQWIPAEQGANKTFFAGASLDGAFFSIGLDTLKNNPKQTILLGEGFATMAKVHELTSYPVVAAMSCHRLVEVATIIHANFPEATIIVMADNDHKTELKTKQNPGIKHAQEVCKKKLAASVVFPAFTQNENGSDWDDFALLHGDVDTARIILNDLQDISLPANIKLLISQEKLQLINAQDLRVKHFEPIKWAVPGFLPSGLTILGGAPKTGKSLIALNVGLGIAIGGYVFGNIKVEKGDVLYLALEDTERRLQERIEGCAIDENDDISGLTLAYIVPRQHEGGLEFLDWWLNGHPKARLVIIDTLQKFRKQLSGRNNVYAEDYDVISEIKKLADKFDVAILVLHHLKKMGAKDFLTTDWIDAFSGSAGLSGSADALFVLRRERSSDTGKLYRTGRDVEEKEFWLKLDGFGWSLDGEVEDFTMPTWKRQILDFLKTHNVVTANELAVACGLFLKTAQKNLARLAKEGAIIKTKHGEYSLPADK